MDVPAVTPHYLTVFLAVFWSPGRNGTVSLTNRNFQLTNSAGGAAACCWGMCKLFGRIQANTAGAYKDAVQMLQGPQGIEMDTSPYSERTE